MSTLAELSPAEIGADLLIRWGDQDVAPAGVVIGPTNDTQQQQGVVAFMSAGLPQVEKYASIQWMRAQVRCLAPTLAKADAIAQSVQLSIHGLVRRKARMASSGEWYLVHLCNVTAGPSMHFDSPETWETLLFAEMMISNDPL